MLTIIIPPSEVETVMRRFERRGMALRAEALYLAVLDFYKTKRMATKIQQRLQWIFERREELWEVKGAHFRKPPQPEGLEGRS